MLKGMAGRRAAAVLADENKIVRDAGLVVGGSLLLALCAQISIPLWFTPVPITGQTLGVLLIGAALGSRRGALAIVLYLIEGGSGLPFFRGRRFGMGRILRADRRLPDRFCRGGLCCGMAGGTRMGPPILDSCRGYACGGVRHLSVRRALAGLLRRTR